MKTSASRRSRSGSTWLSASVTERSSSGRAILATRGARKRATHSPAATRTTPPSLAPNPARRRSMAVAVGRALEQAGADAALELAQVASDRGLPEAQRAGRAAQAARLRDREKHPQVVPLHAASLASSPELARSE